MGGLLIKFISIKWRLTPFSVHTDRYGFNEIVF